MKTVDMEVELLDCMGSDLSVVNAARVSMAKRHEEMEESDARLIHYLADHGHWSPFAHAYLSFRVKAPIFVARQLVKHQVGLAWNEVSRRYVDDEPEFYLPRLRERAPQVKQGSKDTVVESKHAHACLIDTYQRALCTYDFLLQEGVAPEVARSVLPVGTMTEWIWSGSLMAFIRVCKLRLDEHAQDETREIAKHIYDFISGKFPHSVSAYFEEV